MAKKKNSQIVAEINAGAQFDTEAVKPIAVAEEVDELHQLVKITIPVHLKIKKKVYAPGSHVVERHLADTMIEMVDKKKRADISVFTGNNYLVERLIDRTLVVSKVESLDMKKIVRK